MDMAEDKRRQLAQLFPEVFTEIREEGTTNGHESTRMGKYRYAIDFEKLKAVLGEFSEILENQKERYGMTWPGKNECLKIIQQPSIATLKPCREESVNFDQTENLFIEGDNLEVLKLLQKAYYGKVKMIYIDPPYNTGKEFIYPDKYAENLDTYLAYTGQVDAEGRKFSTNTEAEGRFHSKWLNMMLPRLYLARNLLREDGVIFVSIDDGEGKNLKALCDEIYGEEQFIGQFVWKSRQQKDNRNTTGASIDHEYVICYGKKIRGEARDASQYSNPDKDPRGDWASGNMVGLATADRRPNLHYDLINPETGINYRRPRLGWRYDQNTMARLIEEKRILWPSSPDGRPRRKTFLSELKEEFTGFSSIIADGVYTKHGTEEVKALFDANIMDFPKPLALVDELLGQATDVDSIILDFFSGSCTTAHAVLDLNNRDGGNRKFIMVQLPEPCDEKSEAFKAGYKTIADIGKERIRRVIKTLEEENKPRIDTNRHESKQEQLFSASEISVHSCSFVVPIGFRVYKLARSNFKVWDSEQAAKAPENIAKQLELHEQHIDPNAGQEDILYELLLKAGFPLTTKIERLYLVDGKLQKNEPLIDTNKHELKKRKISVHSCSFVVPSVFSVADGALLICLEREITKELIKAMADADPLQVICLDEGFKANDQLKANAVQTFKARNQGKDKEAGIVFRTV